MADLAELALTGVPIVTEHYEKVYDPVKNKTKQGVEKVKKMRNNRGGYEEEDDFDGYEYDGPPRRAQTDGRRSDSRRRSGRGDFVEERRVVKTSGGRAKSVGRDGYGSRNSGRSDRRRGLRDTHMLNVPALTMQQVASEISPIRNPQSHLDLVTAAAASPWEKRPLQRSAWEELL